MINPNNGPIAEDTLEQPYKEGIQRLNSFHNVNTIGYVSTNYSQRAMKDVLSDITTYSRWGLAASNGSFELHGVFLDEAVANYTDGNVGFLPTADRAVKGNKEFNAPHMVNVYLFRYTYCANFYTGHTQ